MAQVQLLQTKRSRVSIGSSRVSAHRQRQAREARDREQTTHAGGLTHCSACPPKRFIGDMIRFCPECSAINAARHKAGLIRPNCGPDHANNIINPEVHGKYRGQTRSLFFSRKTNKNQPVITAHIRQLGGGWRQGLASLNGRVVWEGPKTRSMDEAWSFAHERKAWIREGLEVM